MKAKTRLILIVLVVFAMLAALGLSGCNGENNIFNNELKEGAATQIQVEDTHVYMAPEGEPSRLVLKPLVFPQETASQKVYYKLADTADRAYLTVSPEGVLQAKKLKTDEEGNNVDIIVRIISAESPSVSLDITVTIEIVSVERISFNPTTVVVELQSEPVQLEPIFYPAHAITGRAVVYTSQNTAVATVDDAGRVTPVGIGKVAIWVQTPRAGAFDVPVEGYVNVDVRYSTLNYRLDLVSDASTLKQISGSPEQVSFVINMLDEVCDPSPHITWYVNHTTINEVGVKDSKILNYTPSTLPVGEYVIRAVLTNNTQTQELVSENLIIYAPLDAINVDVINETSSFEVGDMVQLLATYRDTVYPPNSYRWTITTPNGDTTVINQAPAVQDSNVTTKADLYYPVTEPGVHTFKAEAIVKGANSGVFSEVVTITVGAKTEGNDINNVYVEGTKVDGVYYPMVMWDALPYSSSYEIEVRKGSGLTETYSTMNSDAQAGYFSENGVYLPSSVATLSDTFSVRVRGSRYGWTEWADYSGTITAAQYRYLDPLVAGFNSYVSDMEELGALLNYLAVFRPDELKEEGSEVLQMTLYVPFKYDDLPSGIYLLHSTDEPQSTQPHYVNMFKLVVAAMRTYVESTNFSIDFPSGNVGGANVMRIQFTTVEAPSQEMVYTPSDTSYTYTESPFITHYTSTPRAESASLPIDALARTMAVSTSNELYLAVSMGYKPIPAAGSKAEEVYALARSVLKGIISNDMTEEQKVHAIYDYLSENVTYDYKLAARTGSEDNYTFEGFYLEGVFLRHRAVCDGIAKAFRLLCQMEGLLSYKVSGTARSGGVGHAWNMVLVDGEWYITDATWASSSHQTLKTELLTHKYLMMTFEESDEDRKTYGIYPDAADENPLAGYVTVIESGYNTYADSDVEITYLVGDYLVDELGADAELWVEIKIETLYRTSLGAEESAYSHINGVITAAVNTEVYTVNTYRNGDCIFVRLRRK